MAQNTNTVTLMTGGDIGPVYEPTEEFAELIAPVLKQADIRLGQCERLFGARLGAAVHLRSRRTAYAPASAHRRCLECCGHRHRVAREQPRDGLGSRCVARTIDRFREMGKTSSAPARTGRSAQAASSNATASRSRCWPTARCCEKRSGGRQGKGRHRVHARSHAYCPGDFSRARRRKSITVPYKEDLEALQEDIRKAKQQADVVHRDDPLGTAPSPKRSALTSRPSPTRRSMPGRPDHRAPRAFDQGDRELYKGKVCFYSIGNFMTPARQRTGGTFDWNLIWHRSSPSACRRKAGTSFPRIAA